MASDDFLLTPEEKALKQAHMEGAEKEMATADGLGALKAEFKRIRKAAEQEIDVRDEDGHRIRLGDEVHDSDYTVSDERGRGRVVHFDEYPDGAVWMMVEFNSDESEEYLLAYNEVGDYYETELESV